MGSWKLCQLELMVALPVPELWNVLEIRLVMKQPLAAESNPPASREALRGSSGLGIPSPPVIALSILSFDPARQSMLGKSHLRLPLLQCDHWGFLGGTHLRKAGLLKPKLKTKCKFLTG